MEISPSLPRLLGNPGMVTIGIVRQNDPQELEFSHTPNTSTVGWNLLPVRSKGRKSRTLLRYREMGSNLGVKFLPECPVEGCGISTISRKPPVRAD